MFQKRGKEGKKIRSEETINSARLENTHKNLTEEHKVTITILNQEHGAYDMKEASYETVIHHFEDREMIDSFEAQRKVSYKDVVIISGSFALIAKFIGPAWNFLGPFISRIDLSGMAAIMLPGLREIISLLQNLITLASLLI